MTGRLKIVLATAVVIAGLTVVARRTSLRSFEQKTLNPGVLSDATPADVGIAFQRLSISSGPRRLDAFLVRADAACPGATAVLIFHGRHETIGDWIRPQRLLHEACISSLVFDYSGHGWSSPPGTIEHLDDDAVAAYRAFVETFPAAGRRCVLSHSLGSGPLLHGVTHVERQPDCVVLASPFSSLRDLAVMGGLPRPLRFILPDVWDDVAAAARLDAPLLWIHSRADATIPLSLGARVYAVTNGPKRALTLEGYPHNAIYQQLPPDLWNPVVAFLQGR